MADAGNDKPEGVGRIISVAEDVKPVDAWLVDEVCTIGRSTQSAIVVPRQHVSRLHARIVREGPRYVLHDAVSVNRTFVNGRRLAGPHLLADRDAIGLGSPEPILCFIDPDPTVVRPGLLRYDEVTMRFVFGGLPLDLTPNELRLLRFLWERAGALCSRDACAAAIWGPDHAPGMDAGALDPVVSNLRGKLRRFDPNAELILTRPGLGYTLAP